MEKVPDNVLNPRLYKKAKDEADKIYKRHGLYKSAFIQKKYQELGGKYKGEKSKNSDLQRWLKKEEWIEVIPYLEQNKKVICGSSSRKNKACRPLIKANDKTPLTINELLKIHGKKKLLEIAKLKEKNMDKYLNWKNGTFVK